MVGIRRGSEDGASGGSDRLPWLEPVEDEDDGDYSTYGEEPGGGGYGGVMVAVLGVLIAIAVITAGIVWFRHHRAATADIGETIHPEPGPYKIKPPNPGGLNTEQTGVVAAGTSAGEDIDSVLDLNAVPETPIAKRAKPGEKPAQPVPAAPAQPQQSLSQMPIPVKPAPVPVPPAAKPVPEAKAPSKAAPPPAAKPVPVKEPPATSGGGSTVQLGAFSTEAKAKAAWKTLSSRFRYLQEMTPVILPVQSGDTKLFRLRASGGSTPAGQVCGQLRIAGETCAAVGG